MSKEAKTYKIQNFTEANAALLPYVPLVAQLTGKDTTLDRIRPLMKLLGDPQNRTRVVHIAGTSGKTSTAYFVAALLRASGKKVGLTVSPHVDSIAERVQIDGKPISEKDFCDGLAAFLAIVDTLAEKPSYFELLYAFSFWIFQRVGVDYAVIETGMGGLHDATNVADRADKLCIITDIGYDHMHVLGKTLPQIAAQKVGIIHEHNTTVMYRQAPEITQVAVDWAALHHADLVLTTEQDERKNYATDLRPDMPDYQQRNWLLAYRAFRYLVTRDSLPDVSVEALRATQAVQVPGRMDVRRVGDKMIVMDGAHNAQKFLTFVRSFQHAYPGVKPAVLLALKQGKEPEDLGPILAHFASEVIVTTFNTSQDLPARAIEPSALVALFLRAGVPNVMAIADQHQAYETLLNAQEKVCVITGSFYLLSQLRAREALI
jgi:dihydrofolate synthase/folylpolyglutamate synthase